MRMNALRPKSGTFRLLWVLIWGPLSLFSAFGPLMVLNLLQFPSIILLPFSTALFRTYNRNIAYAVWGWWAWSIQHLIGLRVNITGDEVPPKENAIVFSNHQGMSDIIIIMCLALAKGRVADGKWMVKDVVKYVPGVGWGLLFVGCLFLKRNWADDEANIRRTFKTYVDGKVPLWLISFPEGTRVTASKLKASQDYARQVGIQPTEHVMLPRSKGFAASVQGLRGHVQAIYSITIGYHNDKVPTLPALIRGELDEVTINVRRFLVQSLPVGEAALAAWLLERFREDDAWMAKFKASAAPAIMSVKSSR